MRYCCRFNVIRRIEFILICCQSAPLLSMLFWYWSSSFLSFLSHLFVCLFSFWQVGRRRLRGGNCNWSLSCPSLNGASGTGGGGGGSSSNNNETEWSLLGCSSALVDWDSPTPPGCSSLGSSGLHYWGMYCIFSLLLPFWPTSGDESSLSRLPKSSLSRHACVRVCVLGYYRALTSKSGTKRRRMTCSTDQSSDCIFPIWRNKEVKESSSDSSFNCCDFLMRFFGIFLW